VPSNLYNNTPLIKGSDILDTVHFYRHFKGFTGGHLKVFDYFNHTLESGFLSASIFFSAESVTDERNPWFRHQQYTSDKWPPTSSDILFLAGDDWQSLPASDRVNRRGPVINLIQGFRHATPGTSVYPYLQNRAIRIFVGEEVANAVLNTGQINGPHFIIPNGIDLNYVRSFIRNPNDRDTDLLIAGLKNPELAIEIAQKIKIPGIRIQCITQKISRADFLEKVGSSRVTLFLPHTREGFYLPPLEGMALETLVVCPCFTGNKQLYRDGYNCFNPEYRLEPVLNAIQSALDIPEIEATQMLDHARQSASFHNIEGERKIYHHILRQLPELWK
jgi:glycosyltransferase involved in cell wall biosynthesis